MNIRHKTKTALFFIGMSMALLITQQLASRLGNVVANELSYASIDPYGIFARVSVHHVVQMAVGLLLILILGNLFKLDFGMKLGKRKSGLKATALFAVVLGGYTLVAYIILLFSGGLPAYDFPLNVQNVSGTLGFQLFLSGPSEEVLFRALPITMLVFAGGKSINFIKIKNIRVSLECFVSALLFSFAHVHWSLAAFSISADTFQLVYAFVLGVIYGVVYQKTGSVVYPMLMHSISNVVMVGTGYVFAVFG